MNMELLQVSVQIVNLLVLPALWGTARYAFRLERRLMKIELKLGIEDD